MAEEPNSDGDLASEGTKYQDDTAHSLFQVMQGDVTDEQLEEWNRLTAQSTGLVQPSSQSGTDSETLASPDKRVLEAFFDSADHIHVGNPPPPPSEGLDPCSDVLGQEAVKERISSILELAASCGSSSSNLPRTQQEQEQGREMINEDDFSAMALNKPEVLATYLTGKLTFGEFFKAVEDARKTKAEERRERKRKADGEFVYEDDDEFYGENDDGDDDDDDDDNTAGRRERRKGDSLWVPSNADPSPKKKQRKPRRKLWELPKDLHGMMGEANSQMAKGNYEVATDLLLELIRQAPNASQPYDSLSMLYDEQGLTAKATEVLLMSAYLKRSDTDLWVTIAERFLDQNLPRKAIMCLTQAIRFADSNKMELMQEKCLLYEQLGDMPKALQLYSQMLALIEPGPENDEKYLTLARKLCESYHDMKRTNDAARILTTMFKTRPSVINSDDMNKLLDLRMTMKQYQACLEGLVDYCGVEATLSDGSQWNQTSPLPGDFDLKAMPNAISRVRVPDNLPQGFPLDLLTKLCCCLIHLRFFQPAEPLVQILLKEDVDEDGNGERFLDVADAFMDADHVKEALPILKRCVASSNYAQAAVWLRYGECLSGVGNLVEAVEAFSKVVELAPNHLGGRVSLSALQQQIGRHDEALKVLSANTGDDSSASNTDDPTLLLHKSHLLYSQKRYEEFITASQRLLFSYFNANHRMGYSKIVLGFRSMKHRKGALKSYMEGSSSQGASDTDSRKDKGSDAPGMDSKVNSDELWEVYLKLCNTLLDMDRMEDLQEVTFLGLTCPAFTNDPIKNKRAEFLCLTVCLMNKDGHLAYNFIKEICLKEPDNVMAWNLFNQSLIYCNEIRHHRFCLRRLFMWPDHIALGIINGHNNVQNGSYRCALGEFMSVFQRTPTDPLISLCIGLCYFHIACQKFTNRKDWLVLEGIAFMNTYLDLRGKCQETYYNLGRAMQQLNLAHAAVYYYKKALAMPPVCPDKEGPFDLSKEIAFNLSLIYKRSGNLDLARLCLQTYVVV